MFLFHVKRKWVLQTDGEFYANFENCAYPGNLEIHRAEFM